MVARLPHVRLAIALLALCIAAGCRYGGTFECASNDQCRRGGATGSCAGGYCAFSDGECASQLRYDSTATPDLAGQCVPLVVDAGTDGASWPCGVKPAAPPDPVVLDDVQDGEHTTITLSNTLVGQGRVAVASPGASLSFVTSFTIVDCICRDCIDQIEIGFVPGPRIACIYDANPGSDGCLDPTSGSAARTLTAPTIPGMYELRFKLGQDFTCNGHPSWWGEMPPPPGTTIAYLCVE